MNCLESIRQKELLAAKFDIGYGLKPLFATVKEGLGLLYPILIELREDTSTNKDLRNCIELILDKGDCSSTTISDVMNLYNRTHDIENTCDRKPIVAIAQPMVRTLSSIEHVLDSMQVASEHCEYLKSAIIKNTPKKEEK